MEIVVVDYRLCAFTYAFHKHKPINEVFSQLSQLLLAKSIKPTKLIFAVDVGTPKRREVYPNYKIHRKEIVKKQKPEEQRRRQQFEEDYKSSLKWLHHFGSVMDINGVEADDIGSIIAHRFADTDYKVTLVTSDKDWSSFLVADNIRGLHIDRNKFITNYNCEFEYDLDPLGIFWMQCFAGSDKENVKGIHKFGPKTFKKFYDETEKDFDVLAEKIKEEVLDKKFRGASLPEGITFEELYKLNYKLFKPVLFEELSTNDQDAFMKKFHVSNATSYDDMMLELLTDYNIPMFLGLAEQSIFKFKK